MNENNATMIILSFMIIFFGVILTFGGPDSCDCDAYLNSQECQAALCDCTCFGSWLFILVLLTLISLLIGVIMVAYQEKIDKREYIKRHKIKTIQEVENELYY